MTQLDERPGSATGRAESRRYEDGWYVPREGRSAGRASSAILLLASVTLIAAALGYVLAGGRLPSWSGAASTSSSVTKAPEPPPATVQRPDPTPPPAPTAPPKPTAQPATPTALPATPTALPATPTAQPATPTALPAPTEAPKPTATAAVAAAPVVPPPATAATVAKPSAPPSDAAPGVMVPVRPGDDPRKVQIERTIRAYFAALGDQDYARAQQVCCTEEWRARYPLDRWQHNFDGVTDLRLTSSPRYLRVEEDVVMVDTDYTFLSAGVRRDFTLRWTFKPVGGQWQAELAEAFSQ